jgi:hypothetical protein
MRKDKEETAAPTQKKPWTRTWKKAGKKEESRKMEIEKVQTTPNAR